MICEYFIRRLAEAYSGDKGEMKKMENKMKITHENLANHPDYEQDVKKCGSRHGIYVRQWRDDIWFCEMCGHRVGVIVE